MKDRLVIGVVNYLAFLNFSEIIVEIGHTHSKPFIFVYDSHVKKLEKSLVRGIRFSQVLIPHFVFSYFEGIKILFYYN
jgi:hypothetical protein